MEQYADGMVKFLMGLMKGIVTFATGILQAWQKSGFLNWVGHNWLTLVIILLIVGVVVDQVVWFLRWRPYYSWMRTWQRLVNRFRYFGRSVKDPNVRAGNERFSAQREDLLRKLEQQDEGKGRN